MALAIDKPISAGQYEFYLASEVREEIELRKRWLLWRIMSSSRIRIETNIDLAFTKPIAEIEKELTEASKP